MARKQAATDPTEPAAATVEPPVATAPEPEREPGDEAPQKQWVQPPDPHSTHGVYWPDRYGIHYQASRGSSKGRQAQIRFGEGTQEDMPKNFDEIKPLLKEHGMGWNPEDKAWGKRMRNQFDRQVRDEVEGLLTKIVALEEKVRGPHAHKTGQERSPF